MRLPGRLFVVLLLMPSGCEQQVADDDEQIERLCEADCSAYLSDACNPAPKRFSTRAQCVENCVADDGWTGPCASEFEELYECRVALECDVFGSSLEESTAENPCGPAVAAVAECEAAETG